MYVLPHLLMLLFCLLFLALCLDMSFVDCLVLYTLGFTSMTDFLYIYNHRNTLQVIPSHVLLAFIITFHSVTVPPYDGCPVSCLSSVLSFSLEYNFLVRERQYLGFGISGALAGSIAVLSKDSHVSLGHPALRHSYGYTYIALMATKI